MKHCSDRYTATAVDVVESGYYLKLKDFSHIQLLSCEKIEMKCILTRVNKCFPPEGAINAVQWDIFLV